MFARTQGPWAPIAVIVAFAAYGCEGPQGPAGPAGSQGPGGSPGQQGTTGIPGTNGRDGLDGRDGQDGEDGQDGRDGTNGGDGESGGRVEVTRFHGTDVVFSSGEYAEGKFLADATITGAEISSTGTVTIDFTVADPSGAPVVGLTSAAATIAKLVPPPLGEAGNRWVPYIYRVQEVTDSANGNWPNPDGTRADQATRDSGGTLTDHGDGSYTYALATGIANVTMPVSGTAVPYEPDVLHRVSIMIGGHSGATASATYDFVPDGISTPLSRDIVSTDACKQCHGEEFAGHGGDRLSVENCVTCHAPGSWDPHGGETMDMKVMIHKIHAGSELASIPGGDGAVWDNPSTPQDETADNGAYAIWGNRNTKSTWWKAGFPAVISNCEKCHQGGADSDNWKTVPSRAACGSCHDTVEFATGINHAGAIRTDDDDCYVCHPPEGDIIPPLSQPIAAVHDWIRKDPRNIPEFDVTLTVSAPANGSYFVAGEAPVVTVVLEEDGTPIDHTTMIRDSTAEGCDAVAGCPPKDGAFTTSSLFVHGPRAKRNPVLTTAARRSGVVATSSGPFDLSAAGASLGLLLDGGDDIIRFTPAGADVLYAGTITVPVSSGTFANLSTATGAEVIAWLNANTAFSRRAIAYLSQGRPAVRSRNLGKQYSMQLLAGPVTSAVFNGDTTVHTVGGTYASNNLYRNTNPADDDPMVARTAGAITYTLDPVDDLEPGTYVASVEITDRGRISATNYKTPSVAVVSFQVKTGTDEPPPAGNCDRCHQGPDGRGFILDFPRHNKLFGEAAPDQCGACHDYQTRDAAGPWSGAGALTRRVHAIHYGAHLNYPLTTVGYSGGDPVPGRNWDIELPMDVRNCQACHPDGETSGSWATKTSRLPCMGCHDSDAAAAHLRIMTFDPTPANQWSGDEEESCQICH